MRCTVDLTCAGRAVVVVWALALSAQAAGDRAPGVTNVRAPTGNGAASCSTAEHWCARLPYTEVANTTGGGDDYDIGAEAGCAGGGVTYPLTGVGDDVVYRIATDQTCTLEIGITPLEEVDLALYALSPNCRDVHGNCVIASDAGGVGDAESVQLQTSADVAYFVIVDGYNGQSGPFELTIAEATATGCALTLPQAGADLGDAPDGTNHSGVPMAAYPGEDGNPGVMAHFPTVFDPATGVPQGPRHAHPYADAWLGQWVTQEADADLLPDCDQVVNINGLEAVSDGDGGDDGIVFPFEVPHCTPMALEAAVTVAPGAPTTARYLNAWMDLNRDGDWDDLLSCGDAGISPEWVIQNQIVFVGPGTYTMQTALFLAANPTPEKPMWIRITLAEQPAPTIGGWADGRGPVAGYTGGETEDYYLSFPPALIFADGFEGGSTDAWSSASVP